MEKREFSFRIQMDELYSLKQKVGKDKHSGILWHISYLEHIQSGAKQADTKRSETRDKVNASKQTQQIVDAYKLITLFDRPFLIE